MIRFIGLWGAMLLAPVVASADAWEEAAVARSPGLKILSKIGAEAGEWRAAAGISVQRGDAVRLRVDPITGADEVRWYQIIPDTSKYYKNANHPWEADAYKWVGFGSIDYKVVELEEYRGKWQIDPLAAAARHEQRLYRGDVGSFWFQAKVRLAGSIRRSPGLEDNDDRNLRPSVCRVTVRSGEGYLGHLTGFFNVPGVFGSIPYQCSNYIGVDCADVLVAAHSKWKGVPNTRDYNVDMLVSQWRKVARATLDGGAPAEPIQWGEQVKPGDLIAVKYAGRRRYQHIGALYRDADGDGRLSPRDEFIHAGPEALHVGRLSRGSFDGEVAILRAQ